MCKYFALFKNISNKQKYLNAHVASFFTSTVFAPLGGANPSGRKASNYIVTFKKGTPQAEIDEHIKSAEEAGATIGHRYTSALLGYSVSVPDDAVNTLDVTHPAIDFVEADGEVTTQGQALLTK